MAIYNDYIKQRGAYVNTRIPKAVKDSYWAMMNDNGAANAVSGGGGGTWNDDIYRQYTDAETKYGGEWEKSLSPVQLADWQAHRQGHSDSLSKTNKIGKGLALAGIGAASLGAGLTGAGLLSGGATGGAGALTGVDAAMADLVASGGLTPTSMGAGVTGAGAAAGGAGLGTTTAGGGMSGLLSGLGSLKDWGSLLTAGAGLVSSLKSPQTAATPNFQELAVLQAKLDQEAADRALVANRPNQVDTAGNTSNWTRDPRTGQWTQTQSLSPANKALLGTSQKAQLDALRGVANRGDFNYQGPSLMDPVGNSEDIQDAWMNLLQPERALARNGEIQRLKNQGLTEDSEAFQRAMLRLDQGDTDAQNKALIYGTQEYGNQFERSLAGRQQGFGEYQTDYNAPMQQYQGLMGIAAPSGQFGNFTTGAVTPGANVYGAGQDQYAANVGNANAANARNNNVTQGLFGLAGNIAKGGWGG